MHDSNWNLVKDKAAKFDEIYTKYGGKKSLSLISSVDLKKRFRLKPIFRGPIGLIEPKVMMLRN